MGEVLASVRRKWSCQEPMGHVSGTKKGDGFLMAAQCIFDTRPELRFWVGAGEGNRTLTTSLEGDCRRDHSECCRVGGQPVRAP